MDEVGVATEAAHSNADGLAGDPEVGWVQSTEGVLLQLSPEPLAGVKLGSVGGQTIDSQPVVAGGQGLTRQPGAVRIAAVPEQKQGRGNPAQQATDKTNHLRAGDAAGNQMQIGMRVGRDRGDRRQLGPIETVTQDRCLPPGATGCAKPSATARSRSRPRKPASPSGARRFCARPSVLDPAPDRLLISVASATGRLLPAPAETMEQTIAVIADMEALPDQIGDPLCGPNIGGEAVGRSPLREQAGQLSQLGARESRAGAGLLAPDQTARSGVSISAPPSPNCLPGRCQATGHLGFGLAFTNPRDGLPATASQCGKISLATFPGDHDLRSHRKNRI
jgi:hypothetical protein